VWIPKLVQATESCDDPVQALVDEFKVDPIVAELTVDILRKYKMLPLEDLATRFNRLPEWLRTTIGIAVLAPALFGLVVYLVIVHAWAFAAIDQTIYLMSGVHLITFSVEFIVLPYIVLAIVFMDQPAKWWKKRGGTKRAMNNVVTFVLFVLPAIIGVPMFATMWLERHGGPERWPWLYQVDWRGLAPTLIALVALLVVIWVWHVLASDLHQEKVKRLLKMKLGPAANELELPNDTCDYWGVMAKVGGKKIAELVSVAEGGPGALCGRYDLLWDEGLALERLFQANDLLE